MISDFDAYADHAEKETMPLPDQEQALCHGSLRKNLSGAIHMKSGGEKNLESPSTPVNQPFIDGKQVTIRKIIKDFQRFRKIFTKHLHFF